MSPQATLLPVGVAKTASLPGAQPVSRAVEAQREVVFAALTRHVAMTFSAARLMTAMWFAVGTLV